MEDKYKDLLTQNRIKHDIRDLCWYDIKISFAIWAFMLFIAVLFVWLVIDVDAKPDVLFFTLGSMVLTGFLGTLILLVYYIVSYFVRPKKYTVVKSEFL